MDRNFGEDDDGLDGIEVSVLDLSAGVDVPETPPKLPVSKSRKYEETTLDQMDALERALNQVSDDEEAGAKR